MPFWVAKLLIFATEWVAKPSPAHETPAFRLWVANCSATHFCIKNTPSGMPENGVFSTFLGGFEPPTFRLGEPLNLCHLCSPMYRKVLIRQTFFAFRTLFSSSKSAFVVRSLRLHFSSFLDFAKEGKRIICNCRRF